jgi:uncharacterized membrane protein
MEGKEKQKRVCRFSKKDLLYHLGFVATILIACLIVSTLSGWWRGISLILDIILAGAIARSYAIHRHE